MPIFDRSNSKYMTTVKNKILGFCEEVTACDCCGKTDLKGTYAIEDGTTGEIKYFGSVCAFKSYNLTTKQLKEGVKAAEAEAIEKARIEFQATEEYKVYAAYLEEREPDLVAADAANDEDTYQAIIAHTIQLGATKRAKQAEICAKYGIKYLYKIG